MMSSLQIVLMSTFLAGLAMPAGAVIARLENIKAEWLEDEFRHSVIAFGGGALLSAVALVLVPEGLENLDPLLSCVCFVAGGFAFMSLDMYLAKKRTPASQLAVMLLDFIPESLALGAAFVTNTETAFLLAGMIALQNLPEGFNAYRELIAGSPYSPNRIVIAFVAMAFLGPVAGLTGYAWLSDEPVAVAATMLFAAGGILYSIFQDLAPQVRLEKRWAPPIGAVLGFLLGMAGFMLSTRTV